MGDDLDIGEIIHDVTSGDLKVMTSNGMATIGNMNGVAPSISISAGTGLSNINPYFDVDGFLDQYSFNKFTVDHKVQEQEFLKLKETVPTYADEIKENLSKNLARDIIKKATFTKKKDIDADVHHFLGRVWVFTEDELKNLINEARNV